MKVFLNFKTYPQGTGEKATELAKICEEVSKELRASKVSKELGLEIIPIVQVVDVYRIKREVNIPIWVQHLDWQRQGQFTGWINLEAVIGAGANGTLLSHSEHQIPPGMVKQVIARVEKWKSGRVEEFETMVCCKTLGQMERLVKFKPDYIAYEITELIGTKNSITQIAPKTIEHAVKICGRIPLVVGAGINVKKDLETAKKLGAKGVLISSAVVLSEKPKEKLIDLLNY